MENLKTMIVLIINENDSHIIRKLYEKYSKFMFKIALDILKDNYSAEDAVQQSLIRIIENIDKIDEIITNANQLIIL